MSNIDENNIQRIIGRLEAEDSRNTGRFKVLRVLFAIFAPLYLIIGTMSFIREFDIFHLLGYVSYMVSFCFGFLLMNMHVQMYDKVDYSLPTLQMLYQAKKRYRILPSRKLGVVYVVAMLLFIGLGQMLIAVNSVRQMFIGVIVLVCSVFVGLMIGCAIWYIHYKPIYDNISKLINDLESK